jgi:hypothetical protein
MTFFPASNSFVCGKRLRAGRSCNVGTLEAL